MNLISKIFPGNTNPKGGDSSKKMRNSLLTVLIAIVLIFIVNAFSARNFSRFDLTAEKRFTLNPATLAMIENLDDIVYFRIYLDGNLPPGLKRFRNQIREMLDEFRAYTNNIMFDFINPMQAPDRDGLMEMLVSRGIQPTQVQRRADDATSQQVVIPGALVSYRDMEVPINFLVSQGAHQHHEEVLNNSVQALEYNLANAIRELIQDERKLIGFVQGQGDLQNLQLADVAENISRFYDIVRVEIDNNLEEILEFETLVLPKPTIPFDERQKFIIDQFIMQGGKVFWLLDPVFATMDSLRPPATQTIGMPNLVNLDDMLFRYGVRLNSVLVKDLRSVSIPMITGMVGDSPSYSLVPWPFFPQLDAASDHVIVRNINLVAGEFTSTIDTVTSSGIIKTPLLQTSQYTRIIPTPSPISFAFLREPLDERNFNAGEQNVAYLLEGRFESVFRNRPNPGVDLPIGFEFRENSLNTSMIILADGDIIKNPIDTRGNPQPLGFDPNTRVTYGNLDFMINAINYLTDDSGILQTRSKEWRIRLLDRARANQNKIAIQLANTILPILTILIFGVFRVFWRRRKFGKKTV